MAFKHGYKKKDVTSGPGDPQWEKWALERTAGMIEVHFPFLTTAQSILPTVKNTIVVTGTSSATESLLGVGHCIRTIDRLWKKEPPEIPLKSEVKYALDVAWERSNYLRVVGYNHEVLEKANEDKINFEDSEQLKVEINTLGQQNNWQPNANGQAQAAAQREQNKRNKMIREMTTGGSFLAFELTGNERQGFSTKKVRYDTEGRVLEHATDGTAPATGRPRKGDPGFAGMSTDQIRALYNSVMERRRLEGMSREDLREAVRNNGSTTQYTAQPAYRQQKNTSIETFLINPETNQPFRTKGELVRFVRAEYQNTARLIKPAGQMLPELAREFERILNS